MDKFLREINDNMIILESEITELENELNCEIAFESMLLRSDSIALEANIIQKIKSGVAKL